MKDYYETLEVHPKASSEIIKKAYKVLAARYHPDTCKDEDKEFSASKIRDINEAYSVLGDDRKRQEYDYFYFRQFYSGRQRYQEYKEEQKSKKEYCRSTDDYSNTETKRNTETKMEQKDKEGNAGTIYRVVGGLLLMAVSIYILLNIVLVDGNNFGLYCLFYPVIMIGISIMMFK